MSCTAQRTAREARQGFPSEINHQLNIFHDIFQNPYKKTPQINLDRNIVNIAQCMYETNDFSHMPFLRDALLDKNNSKELLDHALQPNHTKGCWLVDLIKST